MTSTPAPSLTKPVGPAIFPPPLPVPSARVYIVTGLLTVMAAGETTVWIITLGTAAPVSSNLTMSPLVYAHGVATLSQFKLPATSQSAPLPLHVRLSDAESE